MSDCNIQVCMCVTGEISDPNQLSDFLELTPTDMWKKGDIISRTSIRRKTDGWMFSIPKRETLDVGEVIDDLLQSLGAKKEHIRETLRQLHLDVEVSCVVYSKAGAPIINLTNNTLQQVVALGANLDIDLILTR